MTWRRILQSAVALLGAGVSVAAPLAAPHAAEQAVQWKMASFAPSSLVIAGTGGVRLTERLAQVSEGSFLITFHEPGELVPALEMFDAVAKGSVDAAWSIPGYWAGKIRAAPLFSAVPFGPAAPEYLAWIYHGGGQELWKELLAPHEIHPIFCGLGSPAGSGWFRQEITTVADLRGLKMRSFALGARVLQKLGVSTQLLAATEIYPALERGVIDAAEFSSPAIDIELGFDRITNHYYFPGWQKQSVLADLMIHMEKWQELSATHQAQLEAVCGESIQWTIAQGEALQFEALQELKRRGVRLHRWPPEILDALQVAWLEVVAEVSSEDTDFARVWESLSTFRESYALWDELGYVR